jgi:N-acyl homoserine lactone hydrolase
MPQHAQGFWAFDAPTFTCDAGMLAVGRSGPVTIPVPSFMVEHEMGLVLYDTGIHPDAVTDMASVYGDILAQASGARGTVDQRLDVQIRKAGFAPEDVTHIVLSHMHFDHAGGLFMFPNAKVFAGSGEREHAAEHHHDDLAFVHADVEAIRDHDWTDVDLGADVDLFGDGAILIVPTPGHTVGHLSLLVRLKSRPFLLTGDAAHLRVSLDHDLPGPADFDPDQAIKSLHRIKALREETGATVWVSHDPEDWQAYGPGPVRYA